MGEMKDYTFRFRVYRANENGKLKLCGIVTKTIGSRYGEERAAQLAVHTIKFNAAKEQHCHKKDIIVATACLLGEHIFY